MVADLNPGVLGSSPSDLIAFGAELAFVATSPTTGTELWLTDGTAANTRAIDLRPGSNGSTPQSVIVANDHLWFSAEGPSGGRELWSSDGTLQGTTQVADIRSGIASSNPTELCFTGGKLFCFADDGVHGLELFVSDGNGTRLVTDLAPGFASGVIAGTLTPVFDSGFVVFGGTNMVDGIQVWASDGSLLGTQMPGRIGTRPGVGAVKLERFLPFGNQILFACDDGITGLEPWTISLSGNGIAMSQPYGEPCTGTNHLMPRIGALGVPALGSSSFAITLRDARPNSAAVLNAGFAPSSVAFGTCSLLVQLPFVALGTVPTSATGGASVALAVPNDPRLIGALLFTQWAIADAGGPVLGIVTLSDGLLLRVGW